MRIPKSTVCTLIVLLGLASAYQPARATPVPAGLDLFTTSVSPDSYIDFAVEGPIPAGFFYPGSDPFLGVVILEGKPLGQCGGPPLPPQVDTIMRRLTDASPLNMGGSAMVDIQIVALSLTSAQPITVTGTSAPELWWVDVCLRPGAVQPTTQMTINHEFANGGTLSANVSIDARVTFRRLSDSTLRTLDDVFAFTGTPGTWAHTAGDPRIHASVGAGVQLDADCNGACDAPLPVGTSNFIAGYNPQTEAKNPMQHVKPGEKHYIEPPQSPAKIPTVSEWGMVVVLLVMLSAGTIVFGFRRPVSAGADGLEAGGGMTLATFAPALFTRVLAITLAGTVIALAGAMLILGRLHTVDIAGAFVSSIVLAYLIHLWALLKRS